MIDAIIQQPQRTGARVPWWVKVGAKTVLSRVPVPYAVWNRMRLFVHGEMRRPEYALNVVRSHLARVGWTSLEDRVVLELGPGDSLATAVIARALGARYTYLADAGSFASTDLSVYDQLVGALKREGLDPPDLRGCSSVADMLERCRAVYLTGGLRDLASIPSASVDLVFSQAVLEHVRRSDLQPTIAHTHRVSRPGALSSHQVDLRDHLGGSLNHLRFSQRVWESEFMSQSGFYTNRVGFSAMTGLFQSAGFEVKSIVQTRWDRFPTPPSRLAADFRALPAEELLVAGFSLVVERA